MTPLTLDQALENIYTSMMNNNHQIDAHIVALKDVLKTANTNQVTVDPARLAQSNRQGRKLMQAYFRQRGVIVNFAEKA